MRAIRALNATRVLAQSQDEYYTLAIRDETVDGRNHMVSAWEPTPQDIENIKNGGTVYLAILGTVHPPVVVSTTPPEEV